MMTRSLPRFDRENFKVGIHRCHGIDGVPGQHPLTAVLGGYSLVWMFLGTFQCWHTFLTTKLKRNGLVQKFSCGQNAYKSLKEIISTGNGNRCCHELCNKMVSPS